MKKNEFFFQFAGLIVALAVVFGPFFLACYGLCFFNSEEASLLDALVALFYFLASCTWTVLVGGKYMLSIMDAVESWLCRVLYTKKGCYIL